MFMGVYGCLWLSMGVYECFVCESGIMSVYGYLLMFTGVSRYFMGA